MELKDRIKQVRKSLKMNQQEFADLVGTSMITISFWERGNRNPNGSAIKSISKLCGISEEWLLTGEGDMFSETDKEAKVARIATQLMTEDELSIRSALIDTCMELNEEELVAIKKMILQFVEKLK